MSFPIDSLDIPRDFILAASRANLTTESILLTPLPRLAEALKCKIPFAQDLVKAVSRAVVPPTQTVDILLDAEYSASGQAALGDVDMEWKGKGRWISTGDEGFDRCLGGGLRRGCLYEIAGESSAGKSHLVLHLALCSQLPVLTSSPGACFVLNSEREVSADRLVQLAKSMLAKHAPDLPEASMQDLDKQVKGLTDNVLSRRIDSIDALEHVLGQPLHALLEARNRPSLQVSTSSSRAPKPIRLLILDSITALLRGGDPNSHAKPSAPSSGSLRQRSKHLCAVADSLKSLAATYDLAVVVINQVSDVFSRSTLHASPGFGTPPSSGFNQTQPFGPGMGNRGESGEPPMLYATQARWFNGQNKELNKEASLGIVWANAVNVRIMLSRTGRRRLLYQNDLRPAKRRRGCQNDDGPEEETVSGIEVNDAQPTLIRRMHIVFSPFGPSGMVDYVITPSGVHSLVDSYHAIDAVENMRTRWGPLGNDTGRVAQSWGASEKDDEEGEYEEVYDEYGELPPEFWQQAFAGDTSHDEMVAPVEEKEVGAGVDDFAPGGHARNDGP